MGPRPRGALAPRRSSGRGPLDQTQPNFNNYALGRKLRDDPGVGPAFVTFRLDAQGQVDRITMRAISPIADFSFDYQDLLFRPAAARP